MSLKKAKCPVLGTSWNFAGLQVYEPCFNMLRLLQNKYSMYCPFYFQRIAIESNSQSIDSQKHTPVPVQGSLPKPVPSAADAQGGQQQQDQQPYTQYLTTVRTQVACAKEVHDALLECARKLSERQAQVAPQQQTS